MIFVSSIIKLIRSETKKAPRFENSVFDTENYKLYKRLLQILGCWFEQTWYFKLFIAFIHFLISFYLWPSQVKYNFYYFYNFIQLFCVGYLIL